MNWLERILEDPVRFKRLKLAGWVTLAGIVILEVAVHFLVHGHAEFSFEDIPAWDSFYGLLSCVVIILVSKFIGHAWLMRREDYYD